MKRIALLGTGLMGIPVGQRLLAAGYSLAVWNRTGAKAQPLVDLGARACSSAAEAVADAEGVIALLANGPAVTEVLVQGRVEQALCPGALWIDMSSIPPDTAREHAQRLSVRGIEALDAPVSGGVVGAHDGTLAIMVGGEMTSFERARPLFAVLGRATRVGPAGTGALTKLANQMIVGVTIGAVAEALILAEAGGADPSAVRAAIRGGFAESRILELHGERMVRGDFTPGAHCRTQLKDLDSALTAAREDGIALPLTSVVAQLYRNFVEQGGGAELDHSALWLALKALNEGAGAA
ncbi:MAG: NAD(P)-dependent oxidoreductase [Ferrovum sp.]|nr:NAD(P)-dependent oxidoreductase [Ferrovum sp.]NDU86922.1 NAD(P)-dependent oxidoreductase [Ferrovum sp.]